MRNDGPTKANATAVAPIQPPDPERRRAFLACEDNGLMTMFDPENHKPITSLPMAGGADVIKFDPGLLRIYVACGSGAISIFQQDDATHYRKLQDFTVEKKVHSIAVDPSTHKVYTPEKQEDGKPVANMVVCIRLSPRFEIAPR